MDTSTGLKNFRAILGILILLAVLLVFFDPTPTVAQGDFTLPFETEAVFISSGPGEGGYHSFGPSSQAIDFDLPTGTLIYSTKPGMVVWTGYGWNDGYGNLVAIQHHDGTISIYGHLRTIFVKVDQPIGYSTVLGETGNSGNVSPLPSAACPTCGDLLHFEIRNAAQNEGLNVQYLVDWSDGCPGCANHIKGGAVGVPREQFMLEIFMHNSKEKQSVSTSILETGRTYLISIEGSFSFWAPHVWGAWLGDNAEIMCWGIADQEPLIPSPGNKTGAVGSDPEYQYAVPIYPGGCEDGPPDSVDPRPASNVQLSLDGGAVFEKFVSTNATFNSRHEYQYLITGNGHPLIITITDPALGDNYGQLGVSIELFE
jgi:murein DD-endopeptidase MepM/ murein hydrolase activator NlpD